MSRRRGGGCGNPQKLAWLVEGIPAETVVRDHCSDPGVMMTPGPGGLVRKCRGKDM